MKQAKTQCNYESNRCDITYPQQGQIWCFCPVCGGGGRVGGVSTLNNCHPVLATQPMNAVTTEVTEVYVKDINTITAIQPIVVTRFRKETNS